MRIGLLLCDWLRSIENEAVGNTLTPDEQKVVSLVKELLAEADISVAEDEPLSAATLRVWAGTFDDVWVWGCTAPPDILQSLIISNPGACKSSATVRGGDSG
jgi:hypothetical protein